MAVNTYRNTDSTQLSAHFNVREFRCKCGKTHDILISSELIDKLEQLHAAFHCSKIIVTSGYRCQTHDKNVGGNGSGQHTKGTAADICCYAQDGSIISSKLVCCKAQDIGFTGIANIDSSYQYTHVDVRTSGKWYGDEVYGTGTVTDDFYSYYGVSKQDNSVSNTTKIVAKGVDVSYCQGEVDWNKVKASGFADFALIRAGFGREYNQVDDWFERNYSECKRIGIPCGAYWFSYATSVAEAEREAQVFLDTIKGKSFEYPIYMDLECTEQFNLGKAACSAMVDAFLTKLEKAGYFAGLYCSTNFLDNYISDSIKNRYAIWVAQYSKTCTYQNPYGIWQYNVAGNKENDMIGQGSISGISGECDMDYAYIDYPKIIKNAGLNGFSGQNSNIENEESDKSYTSDSSNTDNPDTLEQILQHVASIDKKLQ